MSPEIGYLLPTRERIMRGEHETKSLLTLAERAESLGYDSIWVGDSLLAKPRHDPLTLLAAVAARTERARLGTAVLLPALRNPVLLAHQVATLDRISEGRLILGVGIAADVASVRSEFEAAGVSFDRRVGRMMEGLRLCKALWRGEPVDWDGRWQVRHGVLAPTPHRPEGPPIWNGSIVPAGIERTGRHFDGWFPSGPNVTAFADRWAQVRTAMRAAGRGEDAIMPAIYLTVAIDQDAVRADAAINHYLEQYYNAPAAGIRAWQDCRGGTPAQVGEWLTEYSEAGARHVVLRFIGDHERQLEAMAALRAELGW